MENLSDSANTRNFLAAFASVRGEEKSLAYFRGLNRQIPQYSRFPFTPIRLTTVGDADLVLLGAATYSNIWKMIFLHISSFPVKGLL